MCNNNTFNNKNIVAIQDRQFQGVFYNILQEDWNNESLVICHDDQLWYWLHILPILLYSDTTSQMIHVPACRWTFASKYLLEKSKTGKIIIFNILEPLLSVKHCCIVQMQYLSGFFCRYHLR